MIAHLRSRLQDYLRERRIAHLKSQIKTAQADCKRHLAYAYYARMQAEVSARSPEQVARMERARGLC